MAPRAAARRVTDGECRRRSFTLPSSPPQIRKILRELPPKRQTLMFTATWPTAVRKLAAEFLHQPVQVTVGDADAALTANRDIRQVGGEG